MIAERHKLWETRSWPPPRGINTIAIHAAKRIDKNSLTGRSGENLRQWLGYHPTTTDDDLAARLPTGAILCIADIVEVIETNGYMTVDSNNRRLDQKQYFLGSYEVGRFAWRLKVTQVMAPPITCKGLQRVWNIPLDIRTVIAANIK